MSSREPTLEARRDFTDEVISRLRAAGFALVGICAARPSAHGDAFRRWIEQGQHGEMEYLARHVKQRLDPAALVKGAHSIICVADRHHDGRRSPRSDGVSADACASTDSRDHEHATLPRGRIARYARGDDYHAVMRSRLVPLAWEWRTRLVPHRFRVCVDTAPIMEREHAVRAGLGRIGKNTLLIAEGLGSWLSLGEIVTTYPLLPHRATPEPASSDPCGTCTRCIDACPTQAISPWSVNATKCLSYITIEHDGDVARDLAAASGDWLFGCDDCQEVCPHAQPTRRSRRAGFGAAYDPRIDRLDLLEILGWCQADYDAAPLTEALRRASLAMLKRSAVTILEQHLRRHPNARTLRRRLESLAADEHEDPVVRRAAARALADA